MSEQNGSYVESDHEIPPQINWWLVGTLISLMAFWTLFLLGVPALVAFARLRR